MSIGGKIESERASRYFFTLTIANCIIAAAAATPILVPSLGLPLKLQIWPGTWMLVAYFTFVTAGVLGMLAWSVMYYLAPRILGRTSLKRPLVLTHMILFEVGVLGGTALMGIFPGYIGGTLIHDGIGQFVVTRTIEWAVIPIGTLIFLALVGTLTGLLTIVTGSK